MADDFNFLRKSGDKVTWGEEVLVQGGLSRVAVFGLATGGNRNQGSTKFNRWCQRLYRGERPSVCIGAWSHGSAYFFRAHQCQRVEKAECTTN